MESKRNVMKRKDIPNDDFYDHFSLSSPATKIRRLDAELPPIIEEQIEEPDSIISVDEDQQLPEQNNSSIIIEELPTVENPERALVLYNPLNTGTAAISSPSHFGVSVDSRLISGFKAQYPWFNDSNRFNLPLEHGQDGDDEAKARCQAVVPWVPSQSNKQVQEVLSQGETIPEFMEDDPVGDSSTMEVEDYNVVSAGNGDGSHVVGGARQEQYWPQHQQQQQQHCMMPQFPHNISTPVTWST